MAGFTNLAALITPSVFTGYSVERTKEKTAFIASGILGEDGVLRDWMTSQMGDGGGSFTLNRPTWNDLDASGNTPGTAGAERIGSDANSPLYTGGFATPFPAPQGINTHNEIAVRVERNNHWAASVLAASVSGAKNSNDPLAVIADLVGSYWARRLQKMGLAVVAGVVASNIANNSSDFLFDVSGAAFINGVTNFSAESLFDALQTLGDADSQITNLAVHSVVRNRMRKNNLIDYVRDSEEGPALEFFQGLRLTVDDGMPFTGQVYDSYLFGPGFLRYATVPPMNATETVWRPEAGNGSGSEELWNRVGWCIHPMGHQFIGTITGTSGPSNLATSNNFAAGGSWTRVAQTRKNIPFAVLRTREA